MNNLIDILRQYPNWITHRADKIPLRIVDGWPASSTNPADWTDYNTAVAFVAKNPEFGLGFVLQSKLNITVIDLDSYKTQDQTILANHNEIFESFNTYTELSPSKGGAHIWCYGNVKTRKYSKHFLEIYSGEHYLTITNNAVKDVAVSDCQQLLDELIASMDIATNHHNDMGGAVEETPTFETHVETQTDDEIYQAACGASNGDLFLKLWTGDWKEKYKSNSEADFALIDIIAFYTNSMMQVSRMFRASALGQRKKAQREDYVGKMVQHSFDMKLDTNKYIKDGQLEYEENKSQNETELNEENKPVVWLRPPGLLGDIAEFIYANAVNQVTEVAIAASIAYVAGIVGRTYNISRTGLNQYVILLARTAGGKEGASQGMDKITGALRLVVPTLIDQFIGPSNIASAPALIKQLSETPCMVSHKGEVGFWLQKLCHKYAGATDVDLRGLLLDLFSKSGHGQVVKGSVYSDRAKNVPSIANPCFTLFGDSTQQAFYKAIDEESVAEGLVSRFTIFECANRKTEYNKANNSFPPDAAIIWKLATLVKRCVEKDQTNEVINITETEEATTYHMAFRERCNDLAFNQQDRPTAQIWTRAHLRLLRLAGLAAVCVDPDAPCVTLECLQWAEQIVLHGVEAISKRFETGKVGERSFYLEQKDLLTRVLKGFLRDGFTKKVKSGGVTESLYNEKIVTMRYLQLYTMKHACFRNEKNAPLAFKNICNELVENGLLLKVTPQRLQLEHRTGTAYIVNPEILNARSL